MKTRMEREGKERFEEMKRKAEKADLQPGVKRSKASPSKDAAGAGSKPSKDNA